jgi:hypothetical protein
VLIPLLIIVIALLIAILGTIADGNAQAKAAATRALCDRLNDEYEQARRAAPDYDGARDERIIAMRAAEAGRPRKR